jgi:cation diffusion facilitator family transporter
MSHGANSLKSIMYALGANLTIAAAKLSAALYTGSGAMLAEAVHSLADTGNQLLLIIGIRRSRVPPSDDYPLGHGRAVYFWSFIVALLLFSMGGLFSIYEGVHKLTAHEGLFRPWLAVGILAFSIVMESFSLWGCLREVRKERVGRSLWRWFRESRRSELIVVVGEDLAALAGLTFACAAILLSIATGDPAYDAAGSIAIGSLLVVVAVGVGNEIKGLLIGQSVDEATRHAIAGHIRDLPDVDELLNMITLQQGNDVMLAVKARMKPACSDMELMTRINTAERSIKDSFPQVKWVFFEPDYLDRDEA